jgi:hypothetical protein
VESDYPFGNFFNQELRIVRFSSFCDRPIQANDHWLTKSLLELTESLLQKILSGLYRWLASKLRVSGSPPPGDAARFLSLSTQLLGSDASFVLGSQDGCYALAAQYAPFYA